MAFLHHFLSDCLEVYTFYFGWWIDHSIFQLVRHPMSSEWSSFTHFIRLAIASKISS